MRMQSISSIILSYATYQLFVLLVRQVPDFGPIFFSDVLIDFNRSGIESVAAPPLTTRNPILHPRFRIGVVCFETASRKRMKAASLVVQRFTGLGKSNPPDSGRSTNFVALAFDVHDSALHGFYPIQVYIYFEASASNTRRPGKTRKPEKLVLARMSAQMFLPTFRYQSVFTKQEVLHVLLLVMPEFQ